MCTSTITLTAHLVITHLSFYGLAIGLIRWLRDAGGHVLCARRIGKSTRPDGHGRYLYLSKLLSFALHILGRLE
jgi:hypothetical protein